MSAGDKIRYLLITGFGTGLAPVASGTFGTLPAVAIAIVLQQSGCRGQDLALTLGALAVVLLAFGCSSTGFVLRVLRAKDPKPFVLDEIVGYFVTLGIFAAFTDPTPWGHAAAFFAFRVFDVLKLSPARELEWLPGAPGIMLDDVAAGVYAALVLLGLWAANIL